MMPINYRVRSEEELINMLAATKCMRLIKVVVYSASRNISV